MEEVIGETRGLTCPFLWRRLGWINMKAEKYFNFYQLSDEKKVVGAVVCFEVEALM